MSKSEERTKKFPWKECIATPRVHRSLKRASKPILRVRYRSKQFIKRVTIVGDLTSNEGNYVYIQMSISIFQLKVTISKLELIINLILYLLTNSSNI